MNEVPNMRIGKIRMDFFTGDNGDSVDARCLPVNGGTARRLLYLAIETAARGVLDNKGCGCEGCAAMNKAAETVIAVLENSKREAEGGKLS